MIWKEQGAVDAAAMEKAITKFTDAVSASKQCTGSNASSVLRTSKGR
ncbi:hypothetical protein J2Z21_004631 [Streptomyces griseochromogenes]|uniref:Uncharacterized protein n=1 Tax=Streptomyces griseochromogenes TaxID=68214 RepID=A0ABS4LW55_9ACTN|nr:hypothetical protein [Streptomyces griseochromogenes]